MRAIFDNYKKQKEYLLCIDSDGCVMNGMNIKHFKCFGPCLVKEWELENMEGEVLKQWNNINLYSMTRGINRFKGLGLILEVLSKKGVEIEGLDILQNWIKSSKALSEASLIEEIETSHSFDKRGLQKALNWSIQVNIAIKELPKEAVLPFDLAIETLEKLHMSCDIAIVSSANPEAVYEEWDRYKVLPHVDIVLAQNAGSKADCIKNLLSRGYDMKKVMMIGDAPGDFEAAKKNNVFFYPILVDKETYSWRELERYIGLWQKGEFDLEAGKLVKIFESNLKPRA